MTGYVDSGQGILLPELRLDAVLAASIEALRLYAPKDGAPYWGAFSGGKDSVCLKEVARLAGVPVEWHYNNTTIDPPELVRFIREHHADVKWEQPKRGFFAAVRRNGFPTRLNRWCCREFKESRSDKTATLLIGVRAAESRRRAQNWKIASKDRTANRMIVSPLLYWSDAHVWEFIRSRGIPYCSLYDEGFKRLGCVGCPMAGRQRFAQFKRWPKYERAWRAAFDDIFATHDGAKRFGSAQAMWDWWMSDGPAPNGDDCQGTLELWSAGADE